MPYVWQLGAPRVLQELPCPGARSGGEPLSGLQQGAKAAGKGGGQKGLSRDPVPQPPRQKGGPGKGTGRGPSAWDNGPPQDTRASRKPSGTRDSHETHAKGKGTGNTSQPATDLGKQAEMLTRELGADHPAVKSLKQELEKRREAEPPPPPPTVTKVAKENGWREIRAAKSYDKTKWALALVREELATLRINENDLALLLEKQHAKLQAIGARRKAAASIDKDVAEADGRAQDSAVIASAAELLAELLEAKTVSEQDLERARVVKKELDQSQLRRDNAERARRAANNGGIAVVHLSDDDDELETERAPSDDEAMDERPSETPQPLENSPADVLALATDDGQGYQSALESGPEWKLVQTKKERPTRSRSRGRG